MRKILIDATRLLRRSMNGRLPTGVDRVSLAYIAHYGHRAQALVRWAGQSFVLSCEASERIFKFLHDPMPGLRDSVWPLLGKSAVSSWRHRNIEGRFLLNTGHSGLEWPTYPSMLERQKVKPLFFVHDLIPINYPEYARPGERDRHIKRMDNALDAAVGVIANSQTTLDELTDYAKTMGKRMPPAVAAWLAPGVILTSPGPRPIRPPYFVLLGTIEPRKNHWLMLQLWRRLILRHGENAPRLVIIGQRGWECENVVDLLERCETLRGFVIECARCSDVELVNYLHHAQALLFPSFAEGYGMPMVESLALGVPVIASDLPAFQEIAGDIPEYIDPLDGKRWGDLIEEYSNSASLTRVAQLRRIEGFNAPTWTQHFSIVDEFMERLGHRH